MKLSLILITLLMSWSVLSKTTICSVTINSSDEIKTLRKQYKNNPNIEFVELTDFKPKESTSSKKYNPNESWFDTACKESMKPYDDKTGKGPLECNMILISGHFTPSSRRFYGHSKKVLSVRNLLSHSCNESCKGILEKPVEVFLMGCNTLNTSCTPTLTEEQRESFIKELVKNGGMKKKEAYAMADNLMMASGTSVKDSMKKIFSSESDGAKSIYGFDGAGPLGKIAKRPIKKMFDSIDGTYGDYDRYLDEKIMGNVPNSKKFKVAMSDVFYSDDWQDNFVIYNGTQCSAAGEVVLEDKFRYARGMKKITCSLMDDQVSVEKKHEIIQNLKEENLFLSYLPSISYFLKDRYNDFFSSYELNKLKKEYPNSSDEELHIYRREQINNDEYYEGAPFTKGEFELLSKLKDDDKAAGEVKVIVEAMPLNQFLIELLSLSNTLGWLDVDKIIEIKKSALKDLLVERKLSNSEKDMVCSMAKGGDLGTLSDLNLTFDDFHPDNFHKKNKVGVELLNCLDVRDLRAKKYALKLIKKYKDDTEIVKEVLYFLGPLAVEDKEVEKFIIKILTNIKNSNFYIALEIMTQASKVLPKEVTDYLEKVFISENMYADSYSLYNNEHKINKNIYKAMLKVSNWSNEFTDKAMKFVSFLEYKAVKNHYSGLIKTEQIDEGEFQFQEYSVLVHERRESWGDLLNDDEFVFDTEVLDTNPRFKEFIINKIFDVIDELVEYEVNFDEKLKELTGAEIPQKASRLWLLRGESVWYDSDIEGILKYIEKYDLGSERTQILFDKLLNKIKSQDPLPWHYLKPMYSAFIKMGLKSDSFINSIHEFGRISIDNESSLDSHGRTFNDLWAMGLLKELKTYRDEDIKYAFNLLEHSRNSYDDVLNYLNGKEVWNDKVWEKVNSINLLNLTDTDRAILDYYKRLIKNQSKVPENFDLHLIDSLSDGVMSLDYIYRYREAQVNILNTLYPEREKKFNLYLDIMDKSKNGVYARLLSESNSQGEEYKASYDDFMKLVEEEITENWPKKLSAIEFNKYAEIVRDTHFEPTLDLYTKLILERSESWPDNAKSVLLESALGFADKRLVIKEDEIEANKRYFRKNHKNLRERRFYRYLNLIVKADGELNFSKKQKKKLKAACSTYPQHVEINKLCYRASYKK